ncbi:M1 family metallopeptidase [Flavihumibacter profundi]|uniref:M1 family metallopeptidase n=1 Tax=Flavihumibacter profundi TaxID=2716883 RepID=UPI001CC7D7EF|nr:M1 family metallopeptidase [Flavihumibacter profundi]MBZ5855793.1 M1 family metallopeptidase [Flavihumibacter profundi]
MQLTSIVRGFLASCCTFLVICSTNAQPLSKSGELTHQDTLRGSINAERSWWDVQRYEISVTPDYGSKTIKGSVNLSFAVISAPGNMQIDLQQPMQLDEAILNGKSLSYVREGNVFHIKVDQSLPIKSSQKITLLFSGKPLEAVRPPWDGGWIWTRDKAGNPWMSVACQGLGASVWYPCKDIQSDEPNLGASLMITVPSDLVAVGNGRLKKTVPQSNGTTTYTWEVKNPINNYNIIPYIGKYVSWKETFAGEKGVLDCEYWVLQEDLEAAKAQFQQVKPMLQCFEHWFGPYPFYEDGYKLVESPHLGMEHQSAVAYGNKFKNGYLGRDLSGTGWGLKWDFIIIHESGHEWFGNNITSNDIADMWLHEGFTNYSETIYTECQSGLAAANEYLAGIRKNIRNDIPIIGPYGVNKEGSGDMYPKSANMIHIIRQIIGDDEKFRTLLRNLNKDYYHSTTSSAEIEKYISNYAGKDFSKIFDQYLRTTKIPQLQYSFYSGTMSFRWRNTVDGFNMPVKVLLDGKTSWLEPGTEWQTLKTSATRLEVDNNFYIEPKQLK